MMPVDPTQEETTKRSARISVGEVFGLVENVRAIIARAAEVTT
jgi:hypothetical protein